MLRARAQVLKREMEERRDTLRGVYDSVSNAFRGDSEAARKQARSLRKQIEKRYTELCAAVFT
jgi:ElaB/YqjD/DUF883 family membrane-anchored ribosome-binding protein